MNEWRSLIEWTDGQDAFVSAVFSWDVQLAHQRCLHLRSQGYNVKAGGPAVTLNLNLFLGVADINGSVPALYRHNPNATFTSRGCIRECEFCAVPKIEGRLVELKDWDVKPIVCDNLLSLF